MIQQLHVNNFGPLTEIAWKDLGAINLVLGCNGSGKTFLLKALYAAMRVLEMHRRGNDITPLNKLLFEKLYWTFQVDKLGELVAKNAEAPLAFKILLDDGRFAYSFGRETTRQIGNVHSTVPRREHNAVFLPAKEVLSLHHIILKSREQDAVFGFDDTYLDLARALMSPPTKGKNYKEFATARTDLEQLIGGKVVFDNTANVWRYRKGNAQFNIGVAAEGVKKVAILDTLLGNRYLSRQSVVFIDEPESALHPAAISRFLDIVAALAQGGIQFFLSSHSYFVVKKLFLLAQEKHLSIPVLSLEEEGSAMDDLLEGMPENAIINESIRLYEEEMDLALR
ncbi:ATP-binding protein [Megalodesulfovibrio gigas]|uniref:ATPase AAA-type core domain-containing protein n=1 Tax=Megalodesulfovibrio gigas (strain ATCC 19364 / DSM 1382 / NCIMB 9332 / VKM B-1759) TaxID=1121448 RepID=T2GDQ5_MEGG1|nr:ATP-binding protein [Megalodesulfovibrio gigas]AGW14309.1 hypothetical protein DGI_2577 [Megalodesulfovibrio gigas DSM 1382 = ATCC 19364]